MKQQILQVVDDKTGEVINRIVIDDNSDITAPKGCTFILESEETEKDIGEKYESEELKEIEIVEAL